MNRRNLLLLVFAVVILAQIAVPAWMIAGRELTLRNGEVFKFKTHPVDPYDAFRGRYVWIGLEPNAVKIRDAGLWQSGQKAFAVLGTDADGFAVAESIERTRPGDKPALPVSTGWFDSRNGMMHITWRGLDRFYMTEKKAPAAERAYLQNSVRTNLNCHVTVRVLNGNGVIENLFIDNIPIRDWVDAHAEK